MSHSKRPRPASKAVRKMAQMLLRRDLLMVGVCLVVAGFLSLVIYQIGVYPLQLFLHFSDDVHHQEDLKKLGKILTEAATEDKTVIITTLNKAWSEPNSTFDLFLHSFHVGKGTKPLLRHLVVACLDEEAYSRCSEVHPHRCYFMKTPGIDFAGDKMFMTPDYLKMMWRRIEFLGTLLKLRYNFIFTDIDIMWFRDPFPRLSKEVDFQIACDRYSGDDKDIHNAVNGGFTFVKANQRTIDFYNYWYMSRLRYPDRHDQDVLDQIKGGGYPAKIGLKMRFLDTKYFGGFCEPSRDLDKVCTMHANCCVGLENKIKDLRQVIVDWENYVSAAKTTDGQIMTWRDPENCMKQWWWKNQNKTSIGVKNQKNTI
ncbi:hypothetical protein AtNW77_Chr4g0291171 [Arabidopsis thaliana]|uniref:Nucleotide-diphospho-sugar transferase domain-containing protein n=2 Tax=Arabidopsis TaxID=3701 RepID=A0A178UW58_ARATH|nr:Nucleotide-diphospho-sugar transferase [Arabidopsis thaliana x Arabidopsis arenosa]OAO97853.1 hypothetical protein AXX17_AT4G18690 [Arabidopsis thaliana]